MRYFTIIFMLFLAIGNTNTIYATGATDGIHAHKGGHEVEVIQERGNIHITALSDGVLDAVLSDANGNVIDAVVVNILEGETVTMGEYHAGHYVLTTKLAGVTENFNITI